MSAAASRLRLAIDDQAILRDNNFGHRFEDANADKTVFTTGYIAAMTELVPLEVSEFCEVPIAPYVDSDHGPRSRIVRETINTRIGR